MGTGAILAVPAQGKPRLRVRQERSGSRSDGSWRRQHRGGCPVDDAYIAHAADERLVNSGQFAGMSADEGGKAIVASLAGPGEPKVTAPGSRLADQPPALLGHADPGRLLRTRRHRAGPGRPAAGAPPETVDYAGEWRQPAEPRQAFLRVDCPRCGQPRPTRDRHDGHLHRFLVVLVSPPVPRLRGRARRPRDDRPMDAGRPARAAPSTR